MTTSTTSKKTITGPDAKVGDKITIGGVSHTVTGVAGTELTVEETWEVRRRKPRKLTAHKERGHSWWPRKNADVSHYACARCGATKEPGTAAFETCDESVVRTVHSL